MITVTLNNPSFLFLVDNGNAVAYPYRLLITGLINPLYPDTYEIRSNLYFQDSSSNQYVYSKPLSAVITAANLAGSTGFSLLSS